MPFYQGIFRSDPPPVQPVPHVPIPAQGQTPPKGPTQLLVDSIIIKWAWEPPPPMPWQKPLTQAPLTLTYGQQPPKGPTQLLVDSIIVKWSWEPPPPMPRQLPLTVAPLTLRYGSQPPLGCQPFTITENVIYYAWQPPDPQPQNTIRKIASFTPTLATFVSFFRLPDSVLSSWKFADPLPTVPDYIAPQTLVYGQQPPPLIRQSIPQQREDWMPQARSQAAALIPAVTFVSFMRLPDSVLASWRAGDPQPTLPRNIVPLTLTYGNQPPRYSIRDMVLLVSAWNPPDPMPVQSPRWTAAITAPFVVVDIGGWVEATQTYIPGAVANQIYVQGAVAMQTYLQGAVAEEEKDSQP